MFVRVYIDKKSHKNIKKHNIFKKYNCQIVYIAYNIRGFFYERNGHIMKLKIDDCVFELVRDLLVSHDSLIKNVEKDVDGSVIVTLHENSSQRDLEKFLSQGPLHTFCAYSTVSRV